MSASAHVSEIKNGIEPQTIEKIASKLEDAKLRIERVRCALTRIKFRF